MFRVVWGSMARCDAILPVAALDGSWTCLTSTTFQGAGLRIKGCMSSNDFGPDIFYEVFIKSTKTNLLAQYLRILRGTAVQHQYTHPHSAHLTLSTTTATRVPPKSPHSAFDYPAKQQPQEFQAQQHTLSHIRAPCTFSGSGSANHAIPGFPASFSMNAWLIATADEKRTRSQRSVLIWRAA